MRVYLSPQYSTVKNIVKINGEQVQINNKLYDFTRLPNGVLRTTNSEIISAKRIDGELYVKILNKLDDTATQDELYPQWQTIERNDALHDGLTLVDLDWYSEDERVSDDLLNTLKPSQQELLDADLEIKMLTLLMEMEVI